MLALPAGDPGISSSRLAPPQIRHRPRLDPPYPTPPRFAGRGIGGGADRRVGGGCARHGCAAGEGPGPGELLCGIYGYGFENPSAIQQRAVLPIITGCDVIAQAQSGTGKTSMISLSVCQIVDTSVREVQALIPSPTRELATQTERVMQAVGQFMSVDVHACVGGKSIGKDIKKRSEDWDPAG